jgi:magnesium-transporting ATPase (P-type)
VDDISAAAYNVLFTALPIMAFAVADRPVRHLDTLVRYPQTYHPRGSLTTRAFWKNGVLMATMDAAICFFVPYYARVAGGSGAGSGARGFAGHAASGGVDVFALGKTAFVSILGVVSLEVGLVSRFWTAPFAAALILSYGAVFPFQALYPAALEAVGTHDVAQTGVAMRLFASPRFWLVCGLCAAAAFGHRLAERGVVWLFRPADLMILEEMEAAEERAAKAAGRAGKAGGSGWGADAEASGREAGWQAERRLLALSSRARRGAAAIGGSGRVVAAA